MTNPYLLDLKHLYWWCRRPVTSRWLALFCLMMLVGSVAVMSAGCGNVGLQVQAQTASAVAQAANAGLPMLVDRFRRQGFTVLERVKARGGSEAEARAALASVEAEWKSIWAAWDMLKLAQDRWATALEMDGDTASALLQLKTAYCELRSVWPEGLPAVPLAPLRCLDE